MWLRIASFIRTKRIYIYRGDTHKMKKEKTFQLSTWFHSVERVRSFTPIWVKTQCVYVYIFYVWAPCRESNRIMRKCMVQPREEPNEQPVEKKIEKRGKSFVQSRQQKQSTKQWITEKKWGNKKKIQKVVVAAIYCCSHCSWNAHKIRWATQ